MHVPSPELGEARALLERVAIKGGLSMVCLSACRITLFLRVELPSQQVSAFKNWGGGGTGM